MSAAFVNVTGKQNWTSSLTTSLVSDAWLLTTDNIAVVSLRHSSGSQTPSDFSCHDTLGNNYGSPIIVEDKVFWICNHCLGGSAVVTVSFPSSFFSAITGQQFSGQPSVVETDQASDVNVVGGSISIQPASAHTNQIVILIGDISGSAIPTVSAAPASFTSVYTSGPAGNGPFVGAGGLRVGYNLNTTRVFDGSDTVTASGAPGGSPISVFALIIRQPVIVETNAPSDVTETTATLNGRVTPNDSSQDAKFRWDTVTPPIAHTTATIDTIANSQTPVGYSTGLSGLTPGLQYYVRAIAVDDLGGETLGPIRSFRAGEAIFETDGDVSQPLTYANWHHDDRVHSLAEVDLNDRDTYYHGFKEGIVQQWKPITRGLSDRSGQVEHQSFGLTASDVDRQFRGLFDSDDTKYLPNRPMLIRQIDDAQRRLEGEPRLAANGFVSTYSFDEDLTFSFECVGWLRKKFTRQRKSQQAWQALIRPEDFDANTTPQGVLNKPIHPLYGHHTDADEQTVADSDRSTGYLPDPVSPAGAVHGSPPSTTTWRFYLTGMNGFYGDPQIQPTSDHRGETLAAVVDVAGAPDDAALRDQINGGVANFWTEVTCSCPDADEVRVYRSNPDGTGIKFLGYADDLGGGSFSFLDGKYSSTGGAAYYQGADAQPPTRNNTYLQGTLTGGTVTTDTGSGAFRPVYTGLRRGLTDNIVRCEFLFSPHACDEVEEVYLGGVRLPESEVAAYFVIPKRATWTPAFDSRQYYEIFGRRYTTICVDCSYAVAHGLVSSDRLGEGDVALTCNVSGLEDIGDATGTRIDNLFLQARHFAENMLAPDRPFNSDVWVDVATRVMFAALPDVAYVDRESFEALATAYPDLIGVGTVGSVGEDVGALDAWARFLLSGDFQSGEDRFGALIASREPDTVPADLDAVNDVTNIRDRSFRVSDGVLSDFFNILPYRYGRDLSGRTSGGAVFTHGVRIVLPDSDGWASTANGDVEMTDEASQFHFDQQIAAPPMDLHFINVPGLAKSIVSRVLVRYSFPLRRAAMTTPLSGTTRDLGDCFAVTHIEGVGANGWLFEPVRTLRHTLDANDNSVTKDVYALRTTTDRIVSPITFDPITTVDATDFLVVP